MITFQKIRWKNFLSTGNQYTEVNFQECHTNLIIGTNGAGKSTILDALTFALFNKPFRKINKSQLINATNERESMVEVEFSINSRDYIIRRGIKPNIFDIEVNGVPLNKESDDRARQKILEETVLKLNYKSFTQIVILGSSTFVPFMQLTGSNRREVIEDLLDIRIFSAMNNILRDQLKDKKNIVKSLDLKKENLTDKMNMQNKFIVEIEKQGYDQIDSHKDKMKTLGIENDTHIEMNEIIKGNIDDVIKKQEDVIDAGSKLVKLNNLKGKITQKVATITKEHKFFTDNTVCPTCSQNIEESFRLNRIEDAQNRAKELRDGYQKLEESINEETDRERHFTTLNKEISNLTYDISQNNAQVTGLQRQTGDLQQEIQTLTNNLKNRNTEHEKLEKFKQNLEKVFGQLAEENEDIIYNDFAYSLLKDGGVKGKIIKKYLPLINQQVNRYLQMMDFYINFYLDEEFNETIQNPIHDRFSYSSFSEGEKMRIDLALLFTWREVARFKNSTNTNILIMDEVFDSSLDGFGTDEFIKIIKYVVKDANVFVISHKQDMLDKFTSVIEFTKKGGFSYATKSVAD